MNILSSGCGLRTTSASAYLSAKPENLTVWTGVPVTKVLLEGKRAVGVEAADGRQGTCAFLWYARFTSPKLKTC
jgi:choline dehydrogenase-like flavoprotein